MRQYIVNAFTNQLFEGNPAAVCVMERWPEDQFMMNLAAQNNLSETAFIVLEQDEPDENGNPSMEYHFHLRWFTPTEEVGLCGHATLASGFVILNQYNTRSSHVDFLTAAGKVTVSRIGSLYELTFPRIDISEIELKEEVIDALGVAPLEVCLGLDLVCVLDNEDAVLYCRPNEELLRELPGRMVHITSPGNVYTCVTRSFGPKIGIKEDPVCGSAYCQIAPYWSEKTGHRLVTARQASKRGGLLMCNVEDDAVKIAGEARLFSISEIMVKDNEV